MMKVKVEVIKDTCIGCGTCIAVAPEVFEWDSDGKSKVKVAETNDPDLIQKAKNGESGCPVHAIKVIE